ncbi:hypothetical protein [Roseovarius phycicola]|uniref:Uncharacterized protein n=1 Tax=Roseovarius phycicola TaxID=3080976 RepID=A0ABZ2HKV1_9RHOB
MAASQVIKFSLTALALGLYLSTSASSDDTAQPLTAAEIDLHLRGNTIKGAWSGEAYTQFFSEDGQTVYLQQNRRPDVGRWRVNSETNQYESWWEQTGWTGYTVLETKDGYAWKRGDDHEVFSMSAGKQIKW